MTSTATPAEIAAKVRTRGHGNGSRRGRRVKPKAPRKRPSSIWLFVGLGVLALLIAAGAWMWWLASGLLDASRIVQDKAGVAQNELQMFRDTLKAGLKPGARIVSHAFDMGDWKADKTETVKDDDTFERTIYLWTIKKE